MVARAIGATVEGSHPDSVISFAPPSHLYGMMATVLLASKLRVPITYVAPGDRPPVLAADGRYIVAAIPPTFATLFNPAIGWISPKQMTVIHSTAVLPAIGDYFARGFTDEQRLVEIFGSTETGAVATRTHGLDEPDWTLCSDVDFADPVDLADPGRAKEERLLGVRSPRLAHRGSDGPSEAARRQLTYQTGDYITRTGARTFRFAGRRERLLKVNGRRIDLDRLEHRLQSVVADGDVACVPTLDHVRGEGFDVVVAAGLTLNMAALQRCLADFSVTPRQIRRVDSIPRSATGKRLRLAPARVAEVDP
ncbi:AMP-binding enzyme [Jatrophihabitans sp. GAS493]|nr:AMP-binding enzyme [Jatrophihabitans sp. GAS493]